MIEYWESSSAKLIQATVQHIELSLTALFIAMGISTLVTLFLLFNPRFQTSSVYFLSLIYAVPSFALFALLIPLTGLGSTTAILVLIIYAQYMLVRTFLAGFKQVDSNLVEAARGMGMTDWQIFSKIQLPLAKSSIFAGIKLATISIVAIATIASTINAGGLGTILFDGLRTNSLPKLVWGIALTVAVSLLLTLIISLIEILFHKEYENQFQTE